MEMQERTKRTTKKSANLSIDAELLRHARQLKINLSQTLEERLREIVLDAKGKKWVAQNRAALESYNRHVERNGTFSDKLRRF